MNFWLIKFFKDLNSSRIFKGFGNRRILFSAFWRKMFPSQLRKNDVKELLTTWFWLEQAQKSYKGETVVYIQSEILIIK